jgi:hypothetical protein
VRGLRVALAWAAGLVGLFGVGAGVGAVIGGDSKNDAKPQRERATATPTARR